MTTDVRMPATHRRSSVLAPRGASRPRRDPLTRALGWTSLGLGAPMLAQPVAHARRLGLALPAGPAAVALVGVREMVAGLGLLSRRSPAWLWARVGGDAMDLALLGSALSRLERRRMGRTVAATAAVAAITGLDVYAALTRTRMKGIVELTATTTVRRSPQEVYDFWRRVDNLPTFMAHLDEVRVTGDGTSHWAATAPFGKTVEWDAEITDDVPGEWISWQSLPGADVQNEGSVRFTPAPGGRGTEVYVTLCYSMPAGKLGETVARYFGEDPHQQLDDDLRRFKQVMETGEVVRSDGAPGGKRARAEFPQHPARPLSAEELMEEVRA